jgi:hypothetical protein
MITCCSISLAEFAAIAFLIVVTAYITLCNDLLPHSFSLLVWLLILLYYTPYVAQVTCAIYNLIYKLHPSVRDLSRHSDPSDTFKANSNRKEAKIPHINN